MLTTPFLTDIDPQAAVKGSRDPLGIQPIWARLGRHVIGNLTTVSTSPRDFTTTILGYYFAEQIGLTDRGDGDLNVFLRWEQLAGHARYRVNGDGRLRGIERVKRAENEGGKIRIAADASGQILSNQKTYGLWGLYTGPARASGLVEGDPTRVSPASRELIEKHYLPAFTDAGLRNAKPVVELLAQPKTDVDPAGRHQNLLRGVGMVLARQLKSKERVLFREHLMFGRAADRTEGRQDALASAMEESLGGETWHSTPDTVRHLAKRCRVHGEAGEAASERVDSIHSAEQLLAPAASLFDLILGSDGQSLSSLGSTVKSQWGAKVRTIDVPRLKNLESEFRDTSGASEAGQRWVGMAEAFANGEYECACELLMAQNAFVMKLRASAGPWVELDQGKIRVKYRDEHLGALPGRQDLPRLWRHSYFVDALGTIAHELRS